jgi:hypothetical protein
VIKEFVMAKTTMIKGEQDFRSEQDMRTLIEAERIKRDKGRLSRAMKKAKEERAALGKVVDGSKED